MDDPFCVISFSGQCDVFLSRVEFGAESFASDSGLSNCRSYFKLTEISLNHYVIGLNFGLYHVIVSWLH